MIRASRSVMPRMVWRCSPWSSMKYFFEDNLMGIAEHLFCSFKRDSVDALVAFILG